MTRCRILTIGLGVILVTQRTWGSDLSAAVSKLENWQAQDGREDLNMAIDTIRLQASVGDRTMADRLVRIVGNGRLPHVVRMEVLKVACEKADVVAGRKLVAMGSEWVRDLSENDSGDDPSMIAKGYLLYTLVVEGIPRLQALPFELADQKAILSLLRVYATQIATSGKGQYRALELIADNPAPLEIRRACAEDVIAGNAVADVVRDLLDTSSFRKLRALVLESPDAEHFHWVAVSVLAHFGDREILPALEAVRPALREKMGNGDKVLEGYIWMIDVQHPPGRLLEFIRSGEDLKNSSRREWAIRRAVQLDVPKPDIREAILAHAGYHKPDRYGLQAVLATIKKVGVELGVLRPDDLPDVKGLEIPHSP